MDRVGAVRFKEHLVAHGFRAEVVAVEYTEPRVIGTKRKERVKKILNHGLRGLHR